MIKSKNLTRFTILSLLVGLMLLFGFWIGMIYVGPVYFTLLGVPVIVGTLALGLGPGMILTLVFGSISFIKGLTAPSGLESLLLSYNITWVILLCYLPRLLIPVTTWFSKKLFMKIFMKNAEVKAANRERGWSRRLPDALAAVVGSLTNTVFYMGTLILIYLLIGLDSAPILAALGMIVLCGGIPEAAVCALTAAPVMHALQKMKYIDGSDPS